MDFWCQLVDLTWVLTLIKPDLARFDSQRNSLNSASCMSFQHPLLCVQSQLECLVFLEPLEGRMMEEMLMVEVMFTPTVHRVAS